MTFFDLPLSATTRPGRSDLLRLIDVLDRCPYPLLIHCKAAQTAPVWLRQSTS